MKGGLLRAFKDRVESVGTAKNFARHNPLMIRALDRRREGGEHSAKGRTDVSPAGEAGGDEEEAGDGRGLLLRVEEEAFDDGKGV